MTTFTPPTHTAAAMFPHRDGIPTPDRQIRTIAERLRDIIADLDRSGVASVSVEKLRRLVPALLNAAGDVALMNHDGFSDRGA